MAETNYNPEVIRSGANACLAALRQLEVADGIQREISFTWEQHWQHINDVATVLVKASGVTDDYAVGFVSALAEYVEFVNSTGIPNLDAGGWRPKTAMTESEFNAYKKELEISGADEPELHTA